MLLELELLAPTEEEVLLLADVAEDPAEEDWVALLEPELPVIAELLPLARPELECPPPLELTLLDAAPSRPPSPDSLLLLELEQFAAAARPTVLTMAVTMARFMGFLLIQVRRNDGAQCGAPLHSSPGPASTGATAGAGAMPNT